MEVRVGSSRISIRDLEMNVDLSRALRIDHHDLMRELETQAGEYVRWALLYEEEEARLRQEERNLRTLEAELTRKIRLNMMNRGETPTEYVVTAEIRCNDLWREQSKKVLECQRRACALEAIRGAWWQRKAMLEALAQNQRMEYFSAPK